MSDNAMIYDVQDVPPLRKNIVFALQQVLAILAATILVPMIVDPAGEHLNQAAALLGAGFGTLTYLLFTKFKSPVFLGSSFAFITPLITGVTFGYLGVILGAVFAGSVYVVLAIIVKIAGTGWVSRLLPPVVIGPTVALIGLTLSASAIGYVMYNATGNYGGMSVNFVSLAIGILVFLTVCAVSCRGSRRIRVFPFIIGIIVGYIICLVLTLIGNAADVAGLKLLDLGKFDALTDGSSWVPDITFIGAVREGTGLMGGMGDVITIFVAFAPVALVVFAEHIADHENLGTIIGHDLIRKEPGLHRTLAGDGVGSIVGSFFGGAPNTTYGESIGCVALSKNASVSTTVLTAVMCIAIAFVFPVIVLLGSIPPCVMGGICIALYGFIAVSGLRMLKDIDLNDSRNLYVVAAVLVCGLGGLAFTVGDVEVSAILCALVVGVLANTVIRYRNTSSEDDIVTEL